ncbi:MAG: hypothetical protein HRT38_02995 [Alteromonadaceae bacterium]|nr:hypothetical protein [Alteromonadaceae bacterium]
MKSLLEKLGQNPQRSLTIFLYGLGLFVVGLAFVYLGYYQHHLWQLVGIFFVGCGCLVSIWGYIGIFANRVAGLFTRNKKRAGISKNTRF